MAIYKDIKLEILEIDCTKEKLKNFGLLVGGIISAFGLILFIFKDFSLWLLLIGIVLIFLGIIWPRFLKWPYIAWMSLAIVIGYFMFRVFLILLFYLIVTPIGLIRRLVKGDFLNQKINKSASSYWLVRDQKIKSDPEKMF